jgi:hypothetical protein
MQNNDQNGVRGQKTRGDVQNNIGRCDGGDQDRGRDLLCSRGGDPVINFASKRDRGVIMKSGNDDEFGSWPVSLAAIIGAYLVAEMCWEQVFNYFGF